MKNPKKKGNLNKIRTKRFSLRKNLMGLLLDA